MNAALSAYNTDGTADCHSAILSKIPLPPSSNNQYALIRRGRKTYHIPSKSLRDFNKVMTEYHLKNPAEVFIARERIKRWVARGYGLHIATVFFFHKKRLFTKDNRVKKLDVSNRIKSLHDSLARLLSVDDCHFFSMYAEKQVCNDKLDELVYVEISPNNLD